MNRLIHHALALVLILMLVGIAIGSQPCDHNPTWMKMVDNSKDELSRLSVLCWDGGGHTEARQISQRIIQVYCYNGTGYPTGSVTLRVGPVSGSITASDRARRNELVKERIAERKAEDE